MAMHSGIPLGRHEYLVGWAEKLLQGKKKKQKRRFSQSQSEETRRKSTAKPRKS
jgi:hypothetical protein